MWYKEISNDSDVVISTRIRFARNLDNYKFVHMLNSNEKNEVLDKVKSAINNEYKFLDIKNIDETTLFSLVEGHLISKEFAAQAEGAIVINDDNRLVAMVNEEDHLRIQAFEPGFNIDSCYKNIKKFTDSLEEKLKFAKSKKYGYLTSCPTNVGSGMRVSIMLHLPALTKIGVISNILEQVTALGLSVRGLYGENTSAYGNIYQISNQRTLGLLDTEIIDKVKIVVTTIINEERKARNKINSYKLQDEVYRAYGILKNARILKEEEALKLLSKVRLGVCMNIINEVELSKVQQMMIDTQSNSLQVICKQALSEKEEDIKRAEYVRKELD